MINFFKEGVQVPNSNLMRNANTLLVKGEAKINPEGEFSWLVQVITKTKTTLNLRNNFFF